MSRTEQPSRRCAREHSRSTSEAWDQRCREAFEDWEFFLQFRTPSISKKITFIPTQPTAKLGVPSHHSLKDGKLNRGRAGRPQFGKLRLRGMANLTSGEEGAFAVGPNRVVLIWPSAAHPTSNGRLGLGRSVGPDPSNIPSPRVPRRLRSTMLCDGGNRNPRGKVAAGRLL